MSVLHSVTDKTCRHKIGNDIQDLRKTVNQLDPIDFDRTLHQTIAQYTYFSSLDRMVMEINHFLGLKMS